MKREPIPPAKLSVRPAHLWGEQWLLLTAGENRPGGFNCMTVAWGAFGVMWNKPLAMIVVRPSRYTYEFIEAHEDFTLCAFPEARREVLAFCGTKSGRDTDKVKACHLTPAPSTHVAAPGFEEAELILECRKLYFDDLEPAHFLAAAIEKNYSGRDYHRMYFGEILAAQGTAAYAAE